MEYKVKLVVAAALMVASIDAQWTPSPLCPFPSENLTRFPYEGDCSKYWECYEGARYPMDCPSGLEFSPDDSRCDTPENAKCDPDATIIYPTFSHSTVTTSTSSPTPDPGPKPECPFPSDALVFFPVANNCSQYWECFQGNRYLMTCPSGLYWNTLVDYCDYAENVDCSRNNATTTAGPSTTPEDNATTADFTGTTGSEVTITELSTTIVTTEPGSTTTPNPMCIGLADGTYLPDPDDCSKYYECVSQKVIVGDCPGDLLWNQAAHTCDYAENVDCDTDARRFDLFF